MFSGRFVHVCVVRADVLALTGELVLALDVAVLRLAIDDPLIVLVHEHHEPVAALHLIPVVVDDAAREAGRARTAPVVVVLKSAADVVRRLEVVADVVVERQRQVRVLDPGAAHVVRHRHAAVVADQDVIRVVRIDPDRVHVVVRREGRVGFHRPAAVDRHVQAHAAHVDAIRIARIDPDLAEVHRPRVHRADLAPVRAAIVRAIQTGVARRFARIAATATTAACAAAAGWLLRIATAAALLRIAAAALLRIAAATGATTAAGTAPTSAAATAAARLTLDQRVDDVPAAPVHVERDTAHLRSRQAALHSRPVVAAVGRLPHAAAGTAAVHAALRPSPLVGGREHDVGIGRRHHEIVGARLVINRQHALPALSAVCRLVHAAVAAGAE